MYYENNCYADMLTDINLLCCGKRIKPLCHHHGPAIRDNYWLIYIEEGKGEYISDGKSFQLEEKCIIVTFPNRKFYYKLMARKSVKIYWICLDGQFVMQLFETLNITPDHPVIKAEKSVESEKILLQLSDITSSENLNDKLTSIALVYNLFSILFKENYILPPQQNHITRAYHYIKYNYSEGIGTKEIADALNLDRAYFSKLFKRKTGMNPTQYLKNLRMKEACRLLNNNMTVSETAYSVGISDPLYFSKLFSQTFGICPSKYKHI